MIYKEKEGRQDEIEGRRGDFSLYERDVAVHSELEAMLEKSLSAQICSLLGNS